MLEEPTSPYLPPQSGEAAPPSMPDHPPSVIRVFGILHLIFAGMGVLGVISTVVGMIFIGKMGSIINEPGGGGPAGESMTGLQDYMSEIAWFSYLSSTFSLVLAGILIVAGIKLLKMRANALVWSNGYAWFSIGTKIFSIFITFLIVLPASQRIDPSAGDMQRTFSNIATVISSLVSFTYPALTLVLLNRAPVKVFLSSRGT